MRDPALVQVLGPLAPFAEGFRAWLELVGYAQGSRAVHLRLMAQLSGWLGERGLDSSALSPAVMDEFDAHRRDGHQGGRPVRRCRSPLLEYLREVGAAPCVQRHTDAVRPFLTARVGAAGLDLTGLAGADIVAFMLAQSVSAAPATVQRTGTALRSLLGFLHVQGVIDSSLVGAVPAAANWKLAGLVRYLTGQQVAALLASCDQGTSVGRRDLAVLTLLVRLGLRAGEVAGLRLE